jgi:hypothetical protein
MEAARVLRRWNRIRAPPVNGEQAPRSLGSLHRLCAGSHARSQSATVRAGFGRAALACKVAAPLFFRLCPEVLFNSWAQGRYVLV